MLLEAERLSERAVATHPHWVPPVGHTHPYDGVGPPSNLLGYDGVDATVRRTMFWVVAACRNGCGRFDTGVIVAGGHF